VREFGRGEHVWQAGDPADEIYVVLSGEVKDAVVDPDGGEVVHFVHGPGMTFGEPGFFAVDRHRVVATIVIEPAALIRLPRRELQPFLDRYPVVKDRVLERLASDMRWLSAMLVSQARRSLADRVGLRLLEMIDSDASHGDGLVVTPKISQGVLAAMVGVTRENVNRALAGLTADGLIRQERGRYVIVDEATLRARVDRQWPSARRRDRRMM
jgi:CRP-like cAMP-binding protein